MSKEAKRFGRATFYKLWKDDNYAITIDGKKISIKERLNYIHDNLFRNGMVNKQWDFCLQQQGLPGKEGACAYRFRLLIWKDSPVANEE